GRFPESPVLGSGTGRNASPARTGRAAHRSRPVPGSPRPVHERSGRRPPTARPPPRNALLEPPGSARGFPEGLRRWGLRRPVGSRGLLVHRRRTSRAPEPPSPPSSLTFPQNPRTGGAGARVAPSLGVRTGSDPHQASPAAVPGEMQGCDSRHVRITQTLVDVEARNAGEASPDTFGRQDEVQV